MYDRPCDLPLVVFIDDKESVVGCAAHPRQNNGKDFREKYDYCTTQFSCDASRQFAKLSGKQQKNALEMLQEKYGGDWLNFSSDVISGHVVDIICDFG